MSHGERQEFMVWNRAKLVQEGNLLKAVQDELKVRRLAVWNGDTGRVAALQIPWKPLQFRIFPHWSKSKDSGVVENCSTCSNNGKQGWYSLSVSCREHVSTVLSFEEDDGDAELDDTHSEFPSSFICPLYSTDKK